MNIPNKILDAVFPRFCLCCGAHGTELCDACTVYLPLRREQRCPGCFRAITPRGEICHSCSAKKTTSLDGLFAAAPYRSHLVSLAIHTYKYRFIPALAMPLGKFLAERVKESGLPLPDLCVPVPLHKRRLRFRGFNQSAMLAKTFLSALTPGLDSALIQEVLIRKRSTKSQMKTVSRAERLSNLHNAFSIRPDMVSLIKGRSIWLIDDVSTTGTTLEECAKVLKDSGAAFVFGIVLAR